LQLASLASGALILVGFFTPCAALSHVLLQAWLGFHAATPDRREHEMLALIGVVLAMTGPGAWSADARLFGRKRIHVGADV
jgi:uncharacterized membrane protein YphA (DoxX/SURF4 family)